MNHRMQVFMQGLIHQCRKYNVNAELILVDWNPPADRPPLHEVFQWPDSIKPLSIRFIGVPHEVHSRFANSDRFPLFQMIAKNVGIRRSRGKFILATNVDLLFSDELMYYLSKERLKSGVVYRILRHDCGSTQIPAHLPFEQQLQFCAENLVRVQGAGGTEERRDAAQWSIPESVKRDFLTLPAPSLESLAERSTFEKPFSNACGDFQMLERTDWFALRGYHELPKWSIYVDGLFQHMAVAAGLRQVILPEPMRIYHIEHQLGWAVDRNTIQERPSLDYERDYHPWAQKMMDEKRAITLNQSDWGLANEDFPETVIL